MSPADGDLVLSAGGQDLAGWTDVEVIVGIEICPAVFRIAMTERTSETSGAVVVKPGDPCTVKIGGDLVITGYVDRYRPSITGEFHGIEILGRSKSQDMVDCAAEWDGGQIKGSSVLQIAQKLAKPYGIQVKGDVDTGPPLPQFNLTIGESPYAIVERLARYRGLIIYDQSDGSMVLAQAGKDKMGSGFKQGENIQRGVAEYSMDGRFSEIEAFITAVDTFSDLGSQGNLLATAKDPGVPRHRLRVVISEGGALGNDVAEKRAKWEVARRAGRSYSATIVCDSWRDSAGKLWTPNATVPIDAPALKLPKGTVWVISQVSFRRNQREGTLAEVTVMPKDAFLPEPILLQPLPGDVAAGAPK